MVLNASRSQATSSAVMTFIPLASCMGTMLVIEMTGRRARDIAVLARRVVH